MNVSRFELFVYTILLVLALFLYGYIKQLRYKKCPECKTAIRVQARRCGHCGFEFPDRQGKWSKPFYEP